MEKMRNKRKLISGAVEEWGVLNWDRNELEIRLEKLEQRARNFSASADVGVRFRNFLFRHGTRV
jgi:hypothetical protein